MQSKVFDGVREIAATGDVPVRIRGRCMEPLIVEGSEVTVRRARIYLPGDVIVFRLGEGNLAAHRLLGFRPAGFVTRGDHCTDHDAPVPRRDVLGAVGHLRISVRDRVAAVMALGGIIVRRIRR